MAEALAPVLATAALVLCLAGLAKLRAPGGAAGAARALGLPASPGAVRALALLELALGGWCLLAPTRAAAATLGFAYATFALLSLSLARREASCGCFGEGDAPASPAQALLGGGLAALALAAATTGPHSLAWLLHRSPLAFAATAVGTLAAGYGVMLAYTQLPAAWRSWSGG